MEEIKDIPEVINMDASEEYIKSLDALHHIVDRLDDFHKHCLKDNYSSHEVDQLYTALAKAQGEYKPITYNRDNPFFKSQYADLDTIINSVRAALAKNGLALMQQIRIKDDGGTILHTKITHSSGQWEESRNRIVPPKNDVQSYGSILTYLKRYAAMSLLGITVAHDLSDDDGEVAMVEVRKDQAGGVKLNTKYHPKEQSPETITKEQLEELNYELGEYPDICEQILDGFNLQALADMPKSKFMRSITRIREIKAMRNGL